jgi:hypothetical protein
LAELTYHKGASVKLKRVHQLYGLPKLHKVPLAWRPIIRGVCGELEAASKWLDYQLRKIANAVPTYLRDSQEAVTSLKEMGSLPPNARLFTTDTTAVYMNIEPAIGIASVQQWLIDFDSELPGKVPSTIVIKALEMVMTRNTFQFDDTYWQQFVGTAMGTPCACVYATVAYGYHERTSIIAKQTKEAMPYLKRFIDDMLGVWCGSNAEWVIFKASLNGFGKLKWICSEPMTSVTFLDLTIIIDANSIEIHTKIYQKPKNLHLYIPATSAHPEACFQGAVMGNVIRYWKQNTSIKDFGQLLAQFVERLCCRGPETRKVTEGIEKATKYIDEGLLSTWNSTKMSAANKRTLFLHWQYHPNGITRQTLRRLYDKTLAGKDGFDKMTICYSRPRNLREDLTKASLLEPEGEIVSDLINSLDPTGIRELENNGLNQKTMSATPPTTNSP